MMHRALVAALVLMGSTSLVLGIVGYFRPMGVMYDPSMRSTFRIGVSSKGTFYLLGVIPIDRLTWGIRAEDEKEWGPVRVYSYETDRRLVLSDSPRYSYYRCFDGEKRYFTAHIPFGYVVALFVVYPAVAAIRGPGRRYVRRRRGQCERCAYDLRGSETGRCPECGTVWRRRNGAD